MRKKNTTKQGKAIGSTQSLSAFVKSICYIMRRSNCASALQYVPELTWILFLRILDDQEARARDAAEAVGADFTAALQSPFRWQDWAAPRLLTNRITPQPPKANPLVGNGRNCLQRAMATYSILSTKSCCPICTAWILTSALACPTLLPVASNGLSAVS